MATAAQIIANQKNAQASTGPRTDEGKSASSQNALKHGATSQHVVLAFENPAEYEAMRADLFAALKPVGGIEALFVEEMAVAQWRTMRMERIIREYTDRAAYKHPSKNPMVAMADVMLSPEVQKLQRYENSFRRVFDNSWKKLKELQKARIASSTQNKPKSAETALQPSPEPASHAAAEQACNPGHDTVPIVSAAVSTPGR